METLQMTLIALLPSLGTLATIFVLVYKGIAGMRELRKEVRDDAAIIQIKKQTEQMQHLYKLLAEDQLSTHKEYARVFGYIETVKALSQKLEKQAQEMERMLQEAQHHDAEV